MGLLNGHLLDSRLVDPVDDGVAQLAHQLPEEQKFFNLISYVIYLIAAIKGMKRRS